jgi:hypothetical protein
MNRRPDGLSSAAVLRDIEEAAEQCALEARPDGLGTPIERLDNLEADAVGWRTEDSEGRWGEDAVVPLDRWRVLAYGFATDAEIPPMDLDELDDLAREGAERFPSAEE